MKRYFLSLLLIVPFCLSALTLEKGNLKIAADDQTGGYLCYARLSSESAWFPLYVDSFTSSYLQIDLDGQISIPGNSRDYSLRFEQEESALSVIFEGAKLKVTERISFEEDSRHTPYFAISLEWENRGNETVEAGIKKVIDTAFVRGNTHYLVGGESIGEETLFTGSSVPASVLSLGSRPGEKLYLKTRTPPDRLLMANWNRLDRESWDYEPAKGTNFNALPFSINDSALGYYWLPRAVKRGESVKAAVYLGPFDFSLEEEKTTTAVESVSPYVPVADPDMALLHLEEQLEYLDRFLTDVQTLIERGENLSQDEILALEDRLEILERKKQDYEKLR